MKSLPNIINLTDLEVIPIERSDTIPSDWYHDPQMLLIENAAVFSKEWQLVGHVNQLRDPGSSLCLTIADNPIIVIHDGSTTHESTGIPEEMDGSEESSTPESVVNHDGTNGRDESTNHDGVADIERTGPAESHIRAFYNVCKHRGGPLSVKHGTRSVLQCQYHGWTYKSDGSLRGVPHFNHVELFDKKDFGLTPIRLSIWHGLIFVNLSDEAPELTQILDGITERIHPIDLQNLQYHTRTIDLINCNWKVYVDNFLEGYHIPIVHPELAKLLDYSRYVTEISNQYSLQYSPFSDTTSDNPYQAEDGEAWYYFIYPNIMLNILPGRLQTNIIEPIGPDKCRVIFDFYYTDVSVAESSGLLENDRKYSADIQQEDIEICELVQKGLRSNAYDKGRFSVERELGVWHFQSKLKKSLAHFMTKSTLDSKPKDLL